MQKKGNGIFQLSKKVTHRYILKGVLQKNINKYVADLIRLKSCLEHNSQEIVA